MIETNEFGIVPDLFCLYNRNFFLDLLSFFVELHGKGFVNIELLCLFAVFVYGKICNLFVDVLK